MVCVRWLAVSVICVGIIISCFRARPETHMDKDGKLLLSRQMLQRPQYPLVVHAFNWCCKSLVQWAAPFEKERLIAEAVRRTGGLSRFWPGNETYWQSGLDALVQALNEDLNTISALGHLMLREAVLESLTNQLRVEDVFQRHPEIETEVIEAPLVIAGIMRSGETHLQALLCQHPQLSYVTYFDVHHPVCLNKKTCGTFYDLRRWEVGIGVAIVNWLRPLFPKMHRLGTSVPFEEIHYGTHVFGSSLFHDGMLYNIPSYTEWWQRVRIHTPTYRYIRRSLQLIQWQRGGSQGKRWLLKSPQNSEQIQAISEVFPDATFLVTHREPVHTMRSMLSMGAYVMGVMSESINTTVLGQYWESRLQWWLDELVQGYNAVNNTGRFLHIDFERYMQDPLQIIQSILQFAGLPNNQEVQRKMMQYHANHPREGANSFRYDLKEFDLSEEKLAHHFARYNEFRRARTKVSQPRTTTQAGYPLQRA